VLTAEGRAVQRRVGSRHARHVAAAMSRALTEPQMKTLRDLSRKLIAGAPAASTSAESAARSFR